MTNAVNGSGDFATPIAFRASVDARIKTLAKATRRPVDQLRRQFLFHRFLALVFAPDVEPKWVLKGGAGLLMRTPSARFSRDLDLLHLEVGPEAAIADLRSRVTARPGDLLTFVIDDDVRHSTVNPVVTLHVSAYTGATVYGQFPIDLATELHLVATPEAVHPVPVIEVPGLPPMPPVVVYPLADQVADKLCAMFETHGPSGAVSTRFRDLYDLVVIVTTQELHAEPLRLAIDVEAARRDLTLPRAMVSPGPNWQAGYEAVARNSALAHELRFFAPALEVVARCLDPLLRRDLEAGRWTVSGHWQ